MISTFYYINIKKENPNFEIYSIYKSKNYTNTINDKSFYIPINMEYIEKIIWYIIKDYQIKNTYQYIFQISGNILIIIIESIILYVNKLYYNINFNNFNIILNSLWIIICEKIHNIYPEYMYKPMDIENEINTYNREHFVQFMNNFSSI